MSMLKNHLLIYSVNLFPTVYRTFCYTLDKCHWLFEHGTKKKSQNENNLGETYIDIYEKIPYEMDR